MNIINFCNKAIKYSFYAIFLLVPLVFTNDTFELFEFNKMWITFGFTIVIALAWFIKSVVTKEFRIQKTPLDIPILLFLLSQILSTIFSMNQHVSIWGYYSRWNGGLLSIISYIFLYYAFVSNFTNKKNEVVQQNKFRDFRKDVNKPNGMEAIPMVKRLITVSLISAVIVALWGLPSHFGNDPTCLIFRGTFDVSCWTEAFQPKIRMFSTLGQPDWLSAYLAILIPVTIALFIQKTLKNHQNSNNQNQNKFQISPLAVCYFLLTILFYLDLIYTGSRSGFLGGVIAIGLFIFAFLFIDKSIIKASIKKSLNKYLYVLTLIVVLFLFTFWNGTPIGNLNKFLWPELQGKLFKPVTQVQNQKIAIQKPAPVQSDAGGTNSTEIRMLVWKGAIDVWKNNPIFGTGVETFAYAYYRYRPKEHNMVSEWDFLYNKAHNEYLNYLATTGTFGLGTYLLMIGAFLFISFKNLRSQVSNPKQIQNPNNQNSKNFEYLNIKNSNLSFDKLRILSLSNRFGTSNFEIGIFSLALISGYISILITNFFGFSVVIVNLYLFIIPAFVLFLNKNIDQEKSLLKIGKLQNESKKLSLWQLTLISISCLYSIFLIYNLYNFWQADKAYALGHNANIAKQYQQAYLKLHEAVSLRNDEPTFKDELALNDAIVATVLSMQKDSTTATTLAKEATDTSNEINVEYPNDVVLLKGRVRLFYTLSQIDPAYLSQALDAIIKANKLAPTDAKISYNLGLLYGQNNQSTKAIEVLENTIRLKPDYRDAYYALALYYHDAGVDKNGLIKDSALQKKAIDTMRHVIELVPKDDAALQALKAWGVL